MNTSGFGIKRDNKIRETEFDDDVVYASEISEKQGNFHFIIKVCRELLANGKLDDGVEEEDFAENYDKYMKDIEELKKLNDDDIIKLTTYRQIIGDKCILLVDMCNYEYLNGYKRINLLKYVLQIIVEHSIPTVSLDTNIPVFFIKTTQNGTKIPYKCKEISVPKDQYDPCKPEYDDCNIFDLLGVYIHDSNEDFPRRIFIWVDKIEKIAQNNKELAKALLYQVIFHEYAHSIMDVGTHNGISYRHNSDYRFTDEALANLFSLSVCSLLDLTETQKTFINGFVANQPKGYNYGLVLFDNKDKNLRLIKEWMIKKVFANAQQIERFKNSLLNKN